MVEIRKNEFLAKYTSWQIGGPADNFVLPKTIEEIADAIKWAQNQKLPITILGGGSNVLISDKGIRGLTLCLKNFSGLEEKGEELICLSGTSKSELLKYFLKQKNPAALFLAGIPGDIGGGVVMNAGVSENIKPKEFCEIVNWIEVLQFDLKIKKIDHLNWRYRHSEGWQPGIITKVAIKIDQTKDPDILNKVKLANQTRLQKQPLDMPSCGSVFRNPEGHKAAQLIDDCGLKGTRIGDAQVSTKHANFIVNTGEAKAEDTWNLILLVKDKVFSSKKIQLQTEVVRLGAW
jgi:UDP-N-acetylmuramate dehydrogenase